MKRFLTALTLTVAGSFAVTGYTQQSAERLQSDPKATPAYGAMVLRKAAVEAELAHLSMMFKSGHPHVESKRFELSAVSREMERMQAIEKSRAPKLSDTYANLILRKVALEVELNDLLSSFKPQHPDVKKKRVELDTLTREIEKILQ